MAKLFQCCFFNVEEHMLTQLSFSTKYQRWNNTGSSTLNQCNSFRLLLTLFCQRYNNVDKHMSANFHFQPNFNVETTLVHRRWIDVTLSTLYQRCFVNVETTSINVSRLNFHFQPNINVEATLMNVDDQRCFHVDSTLMCLLVEIE